MGFGNRCVPHGGLDSTTPKDNYLISTTPMDNHLNNTTPMYKYLANAASRDTCLTAEFRGTITVLGGTIN